MNPFNLWTLNALAKVVVARVPVQGLTLDEAREAIRGAYEKKEIKPRSKGAGIWVLLLFKKRRASSV